MFLKEPIADQHSYFSVYSVYPTLIYDDDDIFMV